MTLTPLDLRTLCLQMYPDDFRTQALKSTDLDLAPTEDLPLILWRKIQRMRNTDDFTLPVDEMRSILGFNTRTDSDTNNVKNNLLDQILSKTICPSEIHLGHVRDILKDDRHLLKASLYFSPPDEVSLVVDITCPEIARELIAMNWRAYTKLPIHLAIRYDLAMLALKQHLHAYFYIPVQLQQDYRIVHYTISRMDGIYRKLNDELKQDRELIRLAIKRKSINYRWIPVSIPNHHSQTDDSSCLIGVLETGCRNCFLASSRFEWVCLARRNFEKEQTIRHTNAEKR